MKNFILIIAIIVGVILPYGHKYVFLIRYFLMVMLFFSFLDIKVKKEIIHPTHFIILFTNLFFSVIIYLVIKPFSYRVAEAAFITAFAPTAIAAPIIISLKRGNVEFVMFSVMLNNVVVSLLLPFALPFIVKTTKSISTVTLLLPVIETISFPLIIAQLTKLLMPKFWKMLINWKDSTFYILVINIYLAVSDAVTYVQNEFNQSPMIIFLIGLTSMFLCFFFFSLGRLIGGSKYSAEASQALGQKNNAFTLWVSLTFINPIAALGPVFYVFFQNSYITWQLYKHNSSKKIN